MTFRLVQGAFNYLIAIKEEGDENHLCSGTASLNISSF